MEVGRVWEAGGRERGLDTGEEGGREEGETRKGRGGGGDPCQALVQEGKKKNPHFIFWNRHKSRETIFQPEKIGNRNSYPDAPKKSTEKF